LSQADDHLDDTYSSTFEVLPIEFFHTSTGLAARFRPAQDASVTLLDPTGAIRWTQPLDWPEVNEAEAVVHEGLRYVLLGDIGLDNGTIQLASGTASSEYGLQEMASRLPEDLGPLNVTTTHRGWRTTLHLVEQVGDLSLGSGRISVRSEGELLAVEDVAVRDGLLEADLDLPIAWKGRNVTVTVLAVDLWGRTTQRSTETQATANPLLVPSAAVMLGATALAIAGTVRRRWKRP
jgi:hypothetical protein